MPNGDGGTRVKRRPRLVQAGVLAALVVVGLVAPTTRARAQAPSLEAADSLFQAERWEDAAGAYRAILDADSAVAMAWYRLGRVRYEQGRNEDAIPLFHAAERHGFQAVYIRFGLARALAALGRDDEALDQIARAADNGFGMAAAITDDPGLASLRDHPRMAEVLAAVERNAEPCRHSPEAHQLDFWIGTWDVYNPQTGQKVGENVVEPMLKDCAILENWTSAAGPRGKSLNFYDPGRKTWRQVWVSELANVLDYRNGELRDGAMRFEGITIDEQGDTTLQKLTFFDVAPDTVRQVMESSRDHGQSWSTDWVGIYVRRATTPAGDSGGSAGP